jgi:quercetin dioxygenase-like cupin family protein
MKKFKIDSMKGGWFIGDFDPSIVRTKDFEVAIKSYKKGDTEKAHYHKLAIEITVVVMGSVEMNNMIVSSGEAILIDHNEVVCFEALENAITTVVKFPSVTNDKYLK